MKPVPQPLPAADVPAYPLLLPYDGFDPDGKVFCLKDQSIGMIWRVPRAAVECHSTDELGALAWQITSALRLLPEESLLQIIVRIFDEPDEPLARYKDATKREGVFTDLVSSRTRAILDLDLRSPVERFRARGVEVLLTLRQKFRTPSGIKAAARSLLSPAGTKDEIARRYEEAKARLKESAGVLENSLGQAGLAANRLGENDLATYLYRALNPIRSRYVKDPPLLGRKDLDLSSRCCQTPLQLDLDSGLILLEGQRLRVLSLTELPIATRTGMLDPVIRHMVSGFVVINAHVPHQAEVKRFLERKKRLAFCQVSLGGDYKAAVEIVKSQIDQVLADIEGGGARVLSCRVHLIPSARHEPDLQEQTNAIVTQLSQAGFGVVEEDCLAGSLFLQSLPLAYDPANDRLLRRARRLEDANLSHLVPLYGALRGTRSPDLLLLNRDGEPVFFSFFDADEAPHGLVTGISGSGKSVLANNVILNALRQGASVFVLDVGASYRKLCEVLGGTYIDFDPSASLCINPCGSAIDEEKCTFLTELVCEMVTAGKRDASQKERSVISGAIREAFEKSSGREVLIRDLHAALGRRDLADARDLAVALELFCGKGNYARLFDGACNVDFTKDLVVFELGKLAAREDISSVVLMSIIQRITDFCERNRERRKYIVIDEAWTLLDSDATANFIRAVYKTYRKLNTCAIAISQQVDDFDGRAGQAIKDNAPNKIFLKQSPDALSRLQRLLDLSDREREVLGTLETRRGQYSELLILSPKAKGVARLSQDPYAYWITTTDSEDNAYLAELIRKYRDRGALDPVRTAITRASLEKPRGVRFSQGQ